jgi:hypothetical protein
VRDQQIPEIVAADRHERHGVAAHALQTAGHRANRRGAAGAQDASCRGSRIEVEVDFGRDGLAELGRPVVDRGAVGISQEALHGAEPHVFHGQLEIAADQELATRDLGLQLLQLGFAAELADRLQFAAVMRLPCARRRVRNGRASREASSPPFWSGGAPRGEVWISAASVPRDSM